MTTLRDIPAIRKLAEEQAAEMISTAFRVAKRFEIASADLVAVHLDLLCDLTRPASRDAVARLVAERVDLTCGATAPDFGRYACGEHCCDGRTGRMVPCSWHVWSMMAEHDQMVLFADCPDPDEWDGDERRHVPGISAITDPAEALTLIATTVLGASND